MYTITPKKLLNSKWTAVKPIHKEKHFVVNELELDDAGLVLACSIEAVLTRRVMPIKWQDLQDDSQWLLGWK